MRFITMNFSEKESEAINIIKTEQILSKIKRCKRSKIRSNTKLKDYKKIFTEYLVYNIKEYSLSEC